MLSKLSDIVHKYPEVTGIHPACDAVPRMSDSELAELIEDVRANGLMDAIMLTPEGLLLDGRHRLIACYESDSEARFRQIDTEPWSYTCSKNLKRRHLSIGQRAAFAATMIEHEKGLAKERQKEAGGDKKSEKARGSLDATLRQPINQITEEPTIWTDPSGKEHIVDLNKTYVVGMPLWNAQQEARKKAQQSSNKRIGPDTQANPPKRVIGFETRPALPQTVDAPIVTALPQSARAPRSSEIVAKQVNVGERAIDKITKIRQYALDLFEQVKDGSMELEPAYREARKAEKRQKELIGKESFPTVNLNKTAYIIPLKGEAKEISEPKTVRFNRTTDAVDWAKWTWNPVTGCLHGCDFCYAREIAHLKTMEQYYPFKFEPALHEYRLDAPKNTKVPKSDDDTEKRVFVCSMADLFGAWVPEDWIQQVFDACLEAPDWEYMFLTKWPNKYSQVPLLEKACYGASIIQQKDVDRVVKAMQAFEAPGIKKWISLEPMLEPIVFDDLSWCDLMVIGSQTATNQPDGHQPAIAADFFSVNNVVNQCLKQGVPIHLKANLGREEPGMKLPKMMFRHRG